MPIGALPDSFGRTLATLRQGRLKQAELAKAVAVDASTISRYETGELSPSLADAQALLKAIGTSEAEDYAQYLGQQWRWLPRPSYEHPDRPSLWEAESTLDRLEGLRRPANSEPVRQQAEFFEAAIHREATYLADLSHDIAFIGQIAVGKTTALCTAAELMLSLPTGERRIKRTILEAGSGNTTSCEVVVQHDPTKHGLIVLPQPVDEVALLVNDLCAGVLSGRRDQAELDGGRRGIAKEVDRALRNMCGLPKRQEKDASGKRITVDPMIELADGLPNLETLASEVFKRLGLAQRTRSEMWYDRNSGEEPEVWLRKTFANVNNGRAEGVGLPRQITVIAPLPPLARTPYDVRMIDTKGIDEPLADRPDLRGYIEDPRSVPVLCSAFTTAPDQSVLQLLQGTDDTGTGAAVARRSVLLMLAKNDEALQVPHDSGEPAESAEDGYEIRADKVRDVLRRIGHDNLTVSAYNADTDAPEELIASLVGRIESARAVHAIRIKEVGAAVEVLAKVGVAQIYAGVHDRLLQAGRAGGLSPRVSRPFERLILAVRRLHQRTVWASVVRHGSWINLDVYHYLGTALAADAEARSRPTLNQIEAAIGRMLAADEFAPVQEFLKEAMKSVADWQTDFVQSASGLGRDAFRPALKGATQLWSNCAAEYGLGSGFRDRVAGHLELWFNDAGQAGLLKLVEEGLAEQWAVCFESKMAQLIASVRPAAEQS